MPDLKHVTLTVRVRNAARRPKGQRGQLPRFMTWLVSAALVGVAVAASAVQAQGIPSTFDNPNLAQLSADQFTVVDIQKALLWTGYYNGLIDGQQGPGMRAAVVAWQKSRGRPSADTLTPSQLRELIGQAAQVRAEWRWTVYTDPSGRLQIGYPAKLFTPTAPDSQAVMSFGSTDGGFRLQVFLPRPSTRERFEQFYFSNTQQQPAPTVVDYKARAEDWFVVAGTQEQFAFYRKTQFLAPSEVVSFTFVMPNKDRQQLGFLTAAIANSFHVVSPLPGDTPAPPLATSAPKNFGSCEQIETLFSYGSSSFETGNQLILGISAIEWNAAVLDAALNWGRQCVTAVRQASGDKSNVAARMESTLSQFAKDARAGMANRMGRRDAARSFAEALEAETILPNGASVSCRALAGITDRRLGLDDVLFGRSMRQFSDEDFRAMLAKLQDCERTLRPFASGDRNYDASDSRGRIANLKQFRDIKLGEEQRETDAATKQKQEVAALEEDKRLNPTKLPSCNDVQVLRLLTGMLSEKAKEKVELVDAQPRPRAHDLMPDVYVPADGLYRREGMEWRQCLSFVPSEYMGAPRRLEFPYSITWKARAKGEWMVRPE